MVLIGNFNTLTVVKRVPFGYYLDGLQLGEILLPQRYAPDHLEINSTISVFIYCDSEDRLIATTQQPLAQVGQFAFLKCVSVTDQGAFLDWGLPKDLLVPFREQKMNMKEGKSYIVAVFLDQLTQRIAASSKIDKYLNKTEIDLVEGQEVDLLICNETEIGFNAIINQSFWGLLYKNEIFQPITKGMQCKAFIKKLREDNKIDLCLTKVGIIVAEELGPRILQELQNHNGFLPVTDKSSTELIYGMFHESKKSFKKAIGSLYKQRLIIIETDGIRLIN
jgi:predicted RNA-binding protein (virulence factor B family)